MEREANSKGLESGCTYKTKIPKSEGPLNEGKSPKPVQKSESAPNGHTIK